MIDRLLKNMIRRAYVTLVLKDDSLFPVTQVSYDGKAKTVEVMTPYGLYHSLPADALGWLFMIQGSEDDRAFMGNVPGLRFKNLEEGEVVVGNPVTGAKVHFKKGGDIDVTGPANVNLDITGNLAATVGGTAGVTATGDISLTAPNINLTATGGIALNSGTGVSVGGIDFGSHVHSGVTAGASNTGVPV